MNSVWVIRDRESRQYWDGFGFTKELTRAHTFRLPPNQYDLDWTILPVDVLELRLIERDSDTA